MCHIARKRATSVGVDILKCAREHISCQKAQSARTNANRHCVCHAELLRNFRNFP